MNRLVAALTRLNCLRTRPSSTMASTRSRSPPTPLEDLDEPSAKRQRLEEAAPVVQVNSVEAEKFPTKRKRTLPYGVGMHLAPMVRIGTLPMRLLGVSFRSPSHRTLLTLPSAALEYGAELVWGPEIVDKAIIGSERKVDGKLSVPFQGLRRHH